MAAALLVVIAGRMCILFGKNFGARRNCVDPRIAGVAAIADGSMQMFGSKGPGARSLPPFPIPAAGYRWFAWIPPNPMA